MYDAVEDPYCYPGTTVLKNRLDLRTQAELDEFIATMTALRADEPKPSGPLGYDYYCAVHHQLFQDVFDWAGTIRTVRIAKGGNPFCFPENIDAQMRNLFRQLDADNDLSGLSDAAFAAKAAHVMAELNAIHPFREGNGRTQSVFLKILAERAGHPLDFERLDPPEMLQAMIASFNGDEQLLDDLIRGLMRV